MSDKDKWPKNAGVSGFGRKFVVITASDSADLTVFPKAITVIGAGTLAIVPVDNADDEILTYPSVPVGFTPPFIVRRVMNTGTSATVVGVDD